MPVVFRHDGYRFFFFSNKDEPREPVHVHVERDDADAKFRVFPDVASAYNRGFSARVIRQLQDVIEARRDEIEGVE